MFVVEDILVIEVNNNEQQIQITAIDECLGSFSYCDFVILDKEEEIEAESDFSGVWDFI